MDSHEGELRAAKALERRFGMSTLPIRFCWVGPHTVRAIDDETGSYIEANCSGWRMRVTAEHDAA